MLAARPHLAPLLPEGEGVRYDKRLQHFSRELRNKMTEAEKIIWFRIKGKQIEGCQFYRQKIIGDYIVDFCCPKMQVIVEIDGGQHYENIGIRKDDKRDRQLTGLGYKVLRFNNREVFENTGGVVENIQAVLLGRQSPLPPSPKGDT